MNRPYTLRKSLGQHFLKDDRVCQRILETLQPRPDYLLEIGPGGGALTRYLTDWDSAHFCAMEVDEEKVHYLQRRFPSIASCIRLQDILRADMPFTQDFTVIGNFPYQISSQIVFKVLDWRASVSHMTGMFQKEVAQRLCADAGHKEYGILSVLTGIYYDREYLFDVAPDCFIPPPAVQSGVMKMTRKEQPLFSGDYNRFRLFVKTAFGQRRKTIRNALKAICPPEALQSKDFNLRAEQWEIPQFVEHFHQLFPSA